MDPTAGSGLFLHLPSKDGGPYLLQDRGVPSGYGQNSISTQNSKNNANHLVKLVMLLKMSILSKIYIYTHTYTF